MRSTERKLGPSLDTVNVNDDKYDCISTSGSPKLSRLSLIKKKRLGNSPVYRKRISCCKKNDDFGCENESPTSKARRISLVNHMKMKPQTPSQEYTIINQWKEIANDFGYGNESPPSKAQRISLANQMKTRPQMSSQELSINQWKENANAIGNEIKSSPSNALRPLLANQTNMKIRTQSQDNSIYQRKENVHDFTGEDEIPSSKAQEILHVNQMEIKTQAPSHQHSIDKKRLTSGGLVAACKELVNLALSRGSLDDITVMIIDLHRLKD